MSKQHFDGGNVRILLADKNFQPKEVLTEQHNALTPSGSRFLSGQHAGLLLNMLANGQANPYYNTGGRVSIGPDFAAPTTNSGDVMYTNQRGHYWNSLALLNIAPSSKAPNYRYTTSDILWKHSGQLSFPSRRIVPGGVKFTFDIPAGAISSTHGIQGLISGFNNDGSRIQSTARITEIAHPAFSLGTNFIDPLHISDGVYRLRIYSAIRQHQNFPQDNVYSWEDWDFDVIHNTVTQVGKRQQVQIRVGGTGYLYSSGSYAHTAVGIRGNNIIGIGGNYYPGISWSDDLGVSRRWHMTNSFTKDGVTFTASGFNSGNSIIITDHPSSPLVLRVYNTTALTDMVNPGPFKFFDLDLDAMLDTQDYDSTTFNAENITKYILRAVEVRLKSDFAEDNETSYQLRSEEFRRMIFTPERFDSLRGIENIDKYTFYKSFSDQRSIYVTPGTPSTSRTAVVEIMRNIFGVLTYVDFDSPVYIPEGSNAVVEYTFTMPGLNTSISTPSGI